jgi:hypothetical protein
VAEYASGWRTEAIGRKEPSMMIIGCDYDPSWQTILLGGYGDWGDGRKEVGARSGRSGEVLPRIAWGFSDWDGVDGELSMVCGAGHYRGT